MHPVEVTRLRQLAQVAPDGLERDIEAAGEVLDHHPPLGAHEREDLSLTQARHAAIPQGFASEGFLAQPRASVTRGPHHGARAVSAS